MGIYESDEQNEVLAERGAVPGEEIRPSQPGRSRLEEASQGDGALGALVVFLKARGLLDEAVRRELEDGLEYWALERQLSAAPSKATVAQAHRALRLKSFDYRVLNLPLYQLRGAPYDETMLAFLREAELLVEIEDDLKDYHKDVVRNSFNVYRTYVRVHRERAPVFMRTFIQRV